MTARVKIPALVRGDELITATGSFGDVVSQAEMMEQDIRGLAAGMLIGNPFTDVPDLRSNSLVVTNGDRNLAARWAAELADSMWERHETMRARLTDLQRAVQLASESDGTVVLMDAADAPSSGASGDSNAILREIEASGYAGHVLAPIVDAPAVQRAFQTGVGGRVRTTVGGTLDPMRFRPLPVDGHVKLLSDGRFRSESVGSEWFAGADRGNRSPAADARGHEPPGEPLRPISLPVPRSRSQGVRLGRGEVPALRVPHVRRLVQSAHSSRRTWSKQREPCATRTQTLRATCLPAGCSTDVRSRSRDIRAAQKQVSRCCRSFPIEPVFRTR